MNDVLEIDLRKILRDLFSKWKLIVVITIVFGATGFIYSSTRPVSYQAKAIIAIAKPRYLLGTEQSTQNANLTPPTNKAIIELAESDSVIQIVYEAWNDPGKAGVSANDFFSGHMEANTGSDSSIVELIVHADTPETAADLVNTWADATTELSNQLYSGTGGGSLEDYDNQVELANQKMLDAESALIEFQSRQQKDLYQNELDSLLATQVDALRKQRLLKDAIQNAKGLIGQLENQSDSSIVPSSVQLNLILLQALIYGDGVSSTTKITPDLSESSTSTESSSLPSSNLNLQLPADTGSGMVTKAQFKQMVSDWILEMQSQSADLNNVNDEVQPKVNDLKEKIQVISNEQIRLSIEYTNTKELYTSLSAISEEMKLSSGTIFGATQIASRASVPDEPTSTHTVRNTAIGIIAGAVLAMVYVLIIRWWKAEPKQADA